MSLVRQSFLSSRSWGTNLDGTPTTSNWQECSLSKRTTYGPVEGNKNDEVAWPETGYPHKYTGAYLLTLLEFDPADGGKVSRKAVTAARLDDCYEQDEDRGEALEMANAMNDEIWDRLFQDEDRGEALEMANAMNDEIWDRPFWGEQFG
ncbi:hypothetical protein IAR50_004843 [Cryptococcus sp. DSM 104548]